MRELDDILDVCQGLEGENRNAVIATVVHVDGSSYRRPGSRLLLVPDGRRIGSISGGRLESEISRKAWWFTESGEPVVRVYDTAFDDEAAWEFGLGRNGVVHVMLERINSPAAREALQFLAERRQLREASVVATVISAGPDLGQKLLIDGDGRVAGGDLAGTGLDAALRTHIAEVRRAEKSRLVKLSDTDVFLEFVRRPFSLVIFGAGRDTVPVTRFAGQIGWSVTVADYGPAYARPDCFPGADVVVMSGSDLLRGIEINRRTAVVLMTHNYPLDQRLLPRIAAADPFYLGVLGPKSRTERLFSELGIPEPGGLHAPVGLDLGSDDPVAIAMSITAEIQAELAGRTGGMLRDRIALSQARIIESGSEDVVPAQKRVQSAAGVPWTTPHPEPCRHGRPRWVQPGRRSRRRNARADL